MGKARSKEQAVRAAGPCWGVETGQRRRPVSEPGRDGRKRLERSSLRSERSHMSGVECSGSREWSVIGKPQKGL